MLALHPVPQQRHLLRIAAPVPSRLLVTSRPARCITPASGGACSRVCGIRSCRTTPHRPAVARRLVSFSVSFTGVHRRPPPSVREHRRRSRTVANLSEHISAVLESVLGATPQEFESPILRHLRGGQLLPHDCRHSPISPGLRPMSRRRRHARLRRASLSPLADGMPEPCLAGERRPARTSRTGRQAGAGSSRPARWPGSRPSEEHQTRW